ncbi:MAG: dihydrofolate reductase [Clostridiales bacterium]|jgi:dihydrofolate reductase|nr:dihydrofolate reductase [Clostridiales bacterium]
MNLIVAVDQKWGIGKNNGLLFRLPADMAHFKARTTGKVVVMGANTLKSLPGGKPLPNRVNIVLYPGGEKRADCLVLDSMAELINALKGYPTEDIFIIGGAMFYRTMLPYCDTAYITKVDADGGAEVFLDDLDQKEAWVLRSAAEAADNGYAVTFCVYRNRDVKPLEQAEHGREQ